MFCKTGFKNTELSFFKLLLIVLGHDRNTIQILGFYNENNCCETNKYWIWYWISEHLIKRNKSKVCPQYICIHLKCDLEQLWRLWANLKFFAQFCMLSYPCMHAYSHISLSSTCLKISTLGLHSYLHINMLVGMKMQPKGFQNISSYLISLIEIFWCIRLIWICRRCIKWYNCHIFDLNTSAGGWPKPLKLDP